MSLLKELAKPCSQAGSIRPAVLSGLLNYDRTEQDDTKMTFDPQTTIRITGRNDRITECCAAAHESDMMLGKVAPSDRDSRRRSFRVYNALFTAIQRFGLWEALGVSIPVLQFGRRDSAKQESKTAMAEKVCARYLSGPWYQPGTQRKFSSLGYTEISYKPTC
jgi:hypothetical protein